MTGITRGTLKQRGDSWRWQFYVDGVRESRSFSGPVGKKAAWRHVDEKLRPEVQAGLLPSQDQWTVSQFLGEWLKVKRLEVKAESSKSFYNAAIRSWINPHLGKLKVRELSSRDVELWQAKLATNAGRHGGPLARNTIGNAVMVLKQALDWGVEQEPPILMRNVARRIKANRTAPSASRDAYSAEEMLALVKVLKPPYGAAVALGLCGLRMGEALAIRRRTDLDFDRGVILVNEKVISHYGKPPVFEPPKRGKTRTVPMPPWIVPILKEQLEWSVQFHSQLDLLSCGRRRENGGFVDGPVYANRLRAYLTAACQEAGIRKLTFHCLRHTFATLLRRAGMPDVDIAAALGHSNTILLQKTYGNHPDVEQHRNQRLSEGLETYLEAFRTTNRTNMAGS